jgi:S1-C subfamily serine protease
LIAKFLEGSASSDSEGWLGVRVELADSGFVRGLRIVGIETGSPAQSSNLLGAQTDTEGDLLVALNDIPLGTPTRLQQIVTSLLPGTEVDLLLLRDGTFRRVTVRLGAQPRVPKPWQINPPLIQPPSPWLGF